MPKQGWLMRLHDVEAIFSRIDYTNFGDAESLTGIHSVLGKIRHDISRLKGMINSKTQSLKIKKLKKELEEAGGDEELIACLEEYRKSIEANLDYIEEKRKILEDEEVKKKIEEALDDIKKACESAIQSMKNALLISDGKSALEIAKNLQKELNTLAYETELLRERIELRNIRIQENEGKIKRNEDKIKRNEDKIKRNEDKIKQNELHIEELGKRAFARVSEDLSSIYSILTSEERDEIFLGSWKEAKWVDELRDLYKQNAELKIAEKLGKEAENDPTFLEAREEREKKTNLLFARTKSDLQPLVREASETREDSEERMKENQELKAENEELKAENEELKAENEELRVENAIDERQIKRNESEIVTKGVQLDATLRVAAVQTGKAIGEVRKEVKKEGGERFQGDKQEELEKKRQEIQKRLTGKDSNSEKLKAMQERREFLRKTINQKEGDIVFEGDEGKKKELKEQIESMKKEREEINKSSKELEPQIERDKSQLEEVEKQLRDLNDPNILEKLQKSIEEVVQRVGQEKVVQQKAEHKGMKPQKLGEGKEESETEKPSNRP